MSASKQQKTWQQLLAEAIETHGQAEVARRLNLSPSTISMVSRDEYPAATDNIEAKVLELFGGPQAEVIPEGYKKNGLGHLVPIATIKADDLLRDQFVIGAITRAKALATMMAEFKTLLGSDMQAFIDLAAEKYGAELGGQRGNVTLTSFDGRYQLARAVADQLEFDEKLQAAKSLIDECLREWTKDSGPEIRALIDEAFQVDKKGKINTKRILALRRLNIEHETWGQAMRAIGDALTVTGSRTYYRLYERDQRGAYNQIQMDFSAI